MHSYLGSSHKGAQTLARTSSDYGTPNAPDAGSERSTCATAVRSTRAGDGPLGPRAGAGLTPAREYING
jgi:hypothetical protein